MKRFLRGALAALGLFAISLPACAQPVSTAIGLANAALTRAPVLPAQAAMKILRAAEAAQAPTAVNAITPTVSAAYAGSGITGPVTVLPLDPKITPIGGAWALSTSFANNWIGANADAGGANPFGVTGQGIRFATDSRIFDFGFVDTGHFRARYKEQGGSWTWLSAADQATTGDLSIRYVQYDLGSAKPRIIEVYFGDSVTIFGVDVPAPYSIWKAPAPEMPRILVISDSYGRGSINATDHVALVRGSLFDVMGDLVGADVISSSIGGTGYLNAGSAKTFRQRIGDVSRFGPVDMVIIAGGANDNAQTASAITAEVSLYIQAVKAAQPNAIILGLGPWRAPSLNTSTTTNNAVTAGWTPYLDARTYFVDLFAANMQQPSVSAWNTLYQGSDTAHPNDAQHAVDGRFLADQLLTVAHTVAGY